MLLSRLIGLYQRVTLDRYGQIFSTIWYLITVGALIAVIGYFASRGDEMLRLPLQILKSQTDRGQILLRMIDHAPLINP